MNGVTQAGILAGQACLNKANGITPLWTERAIEKLEAWLELRGRVGPPKFTMEEARAGVASLGLTPPHDLRAWGPVTRTAVQMRLMRTTGETAPAASSRGSQKPLYISLI